MAILLHAVADGRPPEFGLVVVVAARVHAEVAADGARVAQGRRRDEGGGAGDGRPALANDRMVRDVGEGRHRAEGEGPIGLDSMRLREAPERHQDAGRELAPLHVRIEVRAAGHGHRVRAVVREQTRGVARGAGGGVAERRQPQHLALLMAGAPDPRPAPSPAPPAPAARRERSRDTRSRASADADSARRGPRAPSPA